MIDMVADGRAVLPNGHIPHAIHQLIESRRTLAMVMLLRVDSCKKSGLSKDGV